MLVGSVLRTTRGAPADPLGYARVRIRHISSYSFQLNATVYTGIINGDSGDIISWVEGAPTSGVIVGGAGATQVQNVQATNSGNNTWFYSQFMSVICRQSVYSSLYNLLNGWSMANPPNNGQTKTLTRPGSLPITFQMLCGLSGATLYAWEVT